MTDQTPYLAGREAFNAGQAITDNPHKPGREDSEEWARGWSAAKWAAKQRENADWAEDARTRAARINKQLDLEAGRAVRP